MPRRLALPALLLVALAACTSGAEQQRLDTESIAAALELYLPRLGEAYSTGDLSGLEGLAAQKEIAAIEKRISDLADQGRVLDPTFHELTVEEVKVFNYANAYVTTVEVWDLRSLATGSREPLAEELGQRNRVKYQLKREGDSWRVLFRQIQQG
jgi:hypothetical protein